MTNIDELVAEIPAFSIESRIRIMNAAMESLNPPDPDCEKLWIAEARRRREEYRSGGVRAIPGEEVFERLFAKFGK